MPVLGRQINVIGPFGCAANAGAPANSAVGNAKAPASAIQNFTFLFEVIFISPSSINFRPDSKNYGT
jgi:hypothetical protein